MVTDDVDLNRSRASARLQERKKEKKPLKDGLTDMKRGF